MAKQNSYYFPNEDVKIKASSEQEALEKLAKKNLGTNPSLPDNEEES